MHDATSQAKDDQHTCASYNHTVTDFWHAINHDEDLIKDQLNVYLFIFLYQYYLGILEIIHRYNQELENYTIKLKNQHIEQSAHDRLNDTEALMNSISEDEDDEIDAAINKSLPKGKKTKKLKPPKQPHLMIYYLHRWLRVALDIEPQTSCRDLFDESLNSLTNSEQLLKEEAKLKANFSVSLQEQAVNVLSHQPVKKDRQTEDQLRLLNEELTETTDESTKRQIEQKIIKLYEDNITIPKNKVESILNLLNLLIQKGNQDKYWDLCLVNGVVLADREQHPLAEDHQWRKLLDVEKFEHRLQAKLVTCWHDPLFLAEVIKFSLMVDCYIVDAKLYGCVVDALNQQNLCSLNDLLYVDVQIDTMNPPRKVFISPLTRVYLQQYYKVFGGHNSALPLNSLVFNDELYRLLGVAKSRYPRADTMSGWFKRVKSYLLFVKGIPGILLHYLTNYGSSYSLKEHKFDQLFSPTSWQGQFTQASAPMEGDGNDETYAAVTRIINPPAWSQVLSVLNVKHISDTHTQRLLSEIIEQLKHIRHQGLLNENEQLLLDWAIYLLSKSVPMMPYSVRKRLFAIGQRLVALAEDCVIAKAIDDGSDAADQTKKHLSPADRLELYRDCLELSVSQHNHEILRGYLHAFEVWLCKDRKESPIPYDEEFNLDLNTSRHRVNASLMLVDDYQFLFDTLSTLSSNTANEDFSYMLMILILGFRLGLRRDEIAGLKLDDYLASDDDPFLRLRTSEARSLKTTNAQRYFRLSDHMPKQEWELINKHFHAIEHKNDTIKRGRIKHLFPQIERIDAKMNHDRYFTPLMSMIRERVKDDEIKFHQLRHSKASFEFLAAFNAQFDLNIDTLFFSSYPLTAEWISNSKHRLIHAMTSQSHLNKVPFWIHEIMGHGSMMMTLGHYVHTLDMVTAGFINKQAKKQMSLTWLSALGLIDKNRYYRYPDKILSFALADEKKRLKSIQSAQMKKDTKENKKLQSVVKSGETANQSRDLSANNPMIDSHLFNYWPYKLYQLLLSQHDATQLTLLADKFSLTNQQVQAYLKFAKEHPKLLFQPVAKNQKAILLKTLQQIERVYELSLQQSELPLVLSEKLKADVSLFEKRLKVRTRIENAIEWVSQYELRCFTKEDVLALVNCIEELGYEASITVFYPTDDTQKLAKVQQYWQQTLTRKDVEYRHESLSNKYGRVHISVTINGKKIQAFYLALAMTVMSSFIVRDNSKKS